MSGRDVLIAGAIGPLGELEVFDAGRARAAVRRAGDDPRGPRRRPVHDRDVLRRRPALRGRRGRSRGHVAPDRRAAHVRRRRRGSPAAIDAAAAATARRARGRRARDEPRRRASGDAEGARRDARHRPAARRDAEHRPREHRRRTRRLPAFEPEYFGEFAAQAVALGARIVGGCCGTTPAQIEAIQVALEEGRAPQVAFEAGERREPVAAVARWSRRRSSRAR